jgi:hypothetical protein
MNNLTQKQVSELSDPELNFNIARLIFKKAVIADGAAVRCIDERNYLFTVNYCNNWNDISPLAFELQLEQEYSEAGLTVSYFELEVHTFDSNFKTIKSPQRAISECAFLVLQGRDNNG